MALFNNNSNVPAFYYVYGNKTYEEEIETYLRAHFQNVINLNLSSSTGCGFKFVSYDVGDLKSLDSQLETYEGWIQTTRRNEFNDLETNVIDLDKAIAGTNNRITGNLLYGNDINWVKFNVNAFKDLTAFRMINILGSAAVGDYVLTFGTDKISASVPVNSSVNNTTIYKKNLNGQSFDLALTDCTLAGYICEFKGSKKYNFTCTHDLTGVDGDFDTVSAEYNIGQDDGWWTSFNLYLNETINMKSLNMTFSLQNSIAPPKTVDVWIDAYLNGVHKGCIHTGGIGSADHYTADNPAVNYYVNYPAVKTVDQINIGFKTPVFNNFDNKLKIYNLFVGY